MRFAFFAENIFLSFLTFTERRKIYSFSKDEEGWQYAGVPALFTEPEYKQEEGRLILKSRDNNTFGFWAKIPWETNKTMNNKETEYLMKSLLIILLNSFFFKRLIYLKNKKTSYFWRSN